MAHENQMTVVFQ